jgi:hypothetical protein
MKHMNALVGRNGYSALPIDGYEVVDVGVGAGKAVFEKVLEIIAIQLVLFVVTV